MAILSGDPAANDASVPKNRLEAMLAAQGGALSTTLYRAVILAEVGPNVNRQDVSTYYTRWVKRGGGRGGRVGWSRCGIRHDGARGGW
ncbi:hypothetical protein AMAG_19579 [Allomyces macrogynus ATCC 38327]|uniref:Uncharacterized protein n=1 Tax=Allomyces macrogynus (strain ATCC 38327) TaxID=578462 RepID=A0A0L0SVJ4_ALLM3|nr:hypothetical protein AMAG_19579 [Allomyces macrogynus ATCC 38327]|eukprot:KNE66466.1 hypothetical protein AMAG_19579 [Allomyces macrogynus ATCC 38327]